MQRRTDIADDTVPTSEYMRRRKRAGWYHDCMVPALRGLSSADPCRYYTSVSAAQVSPEFPGFTVEAPVTLSREGVTALPSKPRPASLLALCEVLRGGELLVIDAALENDKSKLIQALAIQPDCSGFQQAKVAVDVLCEELCLPLR